jgi:hypothetical protein
MEFNPSNRKDTKAPNFSASKNEQEQNLCALCVFVVVRSNKNPLSSGAQRINLAAMNPGEKQSLVSARTTRNF